MNKKTNNIVILISDLGSGGAQRVVCTLAKYWVDCGHPVTVVTLSNPKDDFFHLPHTVLRQTLGLNSPSTSLPTAFIRNIQRVWKLRRILLQVKPRIAIGFVGPTAALLVVAAVATNIYTIAAERNDPRRQSFGKIWNLLCYFGYRYANLITVNSNAAHMALRAKYRSKRVLLTPNPIPLTIDGPTLPLPGSTILFVGRLHEQKGLDLLIRAFASLEAPEWSLLIVGEGKDLPVLQKLSEELGIREKTTFTGAVSDPTPYYRSADIFALPSRYEGTPNALLEAMSYGLPVVTSDALSGPLELIHTSTGGIVTPVENVGALAQGLETLIKDSTLRKYLGAEARHLMDLQRKKDVSYKMWDEALEIPNKTVS